MAYTTINIPCEKDQTIQKDGQVAWIMIGTKRVKCFIQFNGPVLGRTLTHWASGYRMGDLRPVINAQYVRYGNKVSDRTAAQLLMDQITLKRGTLAVLQTIAAAPVINH